MAETDTYKLEREKTIRDILAYVCEYKKLPKEAYNWDLSAVVKECVDEKFLENVETISSLDSHVRVVATCPRVTKLGLDFLYQPSYEDSAAGRQEQLLKNIAENTESLEALKRVAGAAEKRAALAEKEAESAQKDARFSKVISALALLVSAGSLVVAIVALAIGR